MCPCVIQCNGNRMREFSKLGNTASKQPGSLYWISFTNHRQNNNRKQYHHNWSYAQILHAYQCLAEVDMPPYSLVPTWYDCEIHLIPPDTLLISKPFLFQIPIFPIIPH